ncbi:MAG TPA: hypothetical protein VGC87_10090, partial [Pyrinomonadaceae bacterium]
GGQLKTEKRRQPSVISTAAFLLLTDHRPLTTDHYFYLLVPAKVLDYGLAFGFARRACPSPVSHGL